MDCLWGNILAPGVDMPTGSLDDKISRLGPAPGISSSVPYSWTSVIVFRYLSLVILDIISKWGKVPFGLFSPFHINTWRWTVSCRTIICQIICQAMFDVKSCQRNDHEMQPDLKHPYIEVHKKKLSGDESSLSGEPQRMNLSQHWISWFAEAPDFRNTTNRMCPLDQSFPIDCISVPRCSTLVTVTSTSPISCYS